MKITEEDIPNAGYAKYAIISHNLPPKQCILFCVRVETRPNRAFLYHIYVYVNMYDTLSSAIKYLYHNVSFPRATYHTPLIQLPSVRSGVVRVADIFAGIHPNYVGVALIFVCVCVFLYIKIKYPFWNGQPVFHTYDFWRSWSISPSIVLQLPLKTKYYDKQRLISTRPYTEYNRDEIREIVEHLQFYYIPSERIIYNLEDREFGAHFSGGGETPYISLYNYIHYVSSVDGGDGAPKAPKWTNLVNSPQTKKRIMGLITSRHTQLYLVYGNGDVKSFPAYYQDFLCIHREKSKDAQFLRKLFDTHEYNIRVLNPDVKVSVFKKEVQLCDGVVPLIKYFSYTYYLLAPAAPRLSSKYTLSRITKSSADILYDYWGGLKKAQTEQGFVMFSCFILPEVANVVSLIQSKNMWAFCLKRGDVILAMYFFRNAHTNYEEMDDARGNGGNTLHLVASANNTPDANIFSTGFIQCLGEILKENPHFKMLMMDGVGHNQTLIDVWRKHREPVFVVSSAYYVYNLIVPQSPLNNDKCFVLV